MPEAPSETLSRKLWSLSKRLRIEDFKERASRVLEKKRPAGKSITGGIRFRQVADLNDLLNELNPHPASNSQQSHAKSCKAYHKHWSYRFVTYTGRCVTNLPSKSPELFEGYNCPTSNADSTTTRKGFHGGQLSTGGRSYLYPVTTIH